MILLVLFCSFGFIKQLSILLFIGLLRAIFPILFISIFNFNYFTQLWKNNYSPRFLINIKFNHHATELGSYIIIILFVFKYLQNTINTKLTFNELFPSIIPRITHIWIELQLVTYNAFNLSFKINKNSSFNFNFSYYLFVKIVRFFGGKFILTHYLVVFVSEILHFWFLNRIIHLFTVHNV